MLAAALGLARRQTTTARDVIEMELHLETNDTSLELLLPRFKEHTEAKNCNLQIFVLRKKFVKMKGVLHCSRDNVNKVSRKKLQKKNEFCQCVLYSSLLSPLLQIFMIFLRLLFWPSRPCVNHSAVLLFLVKIGREKKKEKNKETFTREAKSKGY